jgi:hypothetical protein
MGKAIRKVGFRTTGQAKAAARVRRGQVRLDKLPKKYRKKLLDPKKKDLLHDKRVTEANDGGDCYEAAAKYMMEYGTLGGSLLRLPGEEGNPDLILIHGEVTGQGPIAGVKYGHAWVEDGDLVIDTSNGRNLRMPKVLYYALAQIDHRPAHQNIHRYTAEEARKLLVKHGHYGPWDLKTSSGL